MKKIKIILFSFLLLAICPNVMALDINHFVGKADNDITMEDNYNSSIAVAGDTVSVDGNVKGIVFEAGNKVTLNGNVDYGVLAGNVININGKINNDTLIAGNLVTTDKDTIFGRDTIIAASDVELKGQFNRNVSVYANKVTLKDVTIKGNIKIYAESVTVEGNTLVEGTLYYPEDSKYKKMKAAQINNIKKTAAIQTEDDENYFATVSAKIWSFLSLMLVFAAITLFIPKAFDGINEKYEKFSFSEGVALFTKGVVVLILVPVIAILLLFTMIGIPLAIILFLLYGLSLYLTTIFTGYLIGYKIWQKAFNKDGHILLFGIIGLFVLLILQLIPGVRIFASIISILIGLGLIFEAFKK